MTTMKVSPPGWLPDPSGRHQLRYWDGRVWTERVSDNSVQGADPPGRLPPPTGLPPRRPKDKLLPLEIFLYVVWSAVFALGAGLWFVAGEIEEDFSSIMADESKLSIQALAVYMTAVALGLIGLGGEYATKTQVENRRALQRLVSSQSRKSSASSRSPGSGSTASSPRSPGPTRDAPPPCQ